MRVFIPACFYKNLRNQIFIKAMKTTISVILLFTILYINYYFPIEFVYIFGMIGAMIIDSVIVAIAAILLAQTIFKTKLEKVNPR